MTRSSPDTWEVEVRVNGDSHLTIGNNHLTGNPEVNEDIVEKCALHLLSFIGRQHHDAAATPCDLSVLIKQYAIDLRRNASGSDDYPYDFAKGVADYLKILIKRAKGNCSCAQAGFPDSCDNCDAAARAPGQALVSIELMQRVWDNLYFDRDEMGTFQQTLNEVVDWLAAWDASPSTECRRAPDVAQGAPEPDWLATSDIAYSYRTITIECPSIELRDEIYDWLIQRATSFSSTKRDADEA